MVWLDFNLHGVGGGGADEEPVGEEDVYREGHHRRQAVHQQTCYRGCL